MTDMVRIKRELNSLRNLISNQADDMKEMKLEIEKLKEETTKLKQKSGELDGRTSGLVRIGGILS